MVVEEEDTTREVKRLWSAVSMVMKQIEVSIVPQCPSLVLEIGVHHGLGAFVGHSANCCTPAAADQEDGAPYRGECEAKGGIEADGEEHPEGPA